MPTFGNGASQFRELVQNSAKLRKSKIADPTEDPAHVALCLVGAGGIGIVLPGIIPGYICLPPVRKIIFKSYGHTASV